MIKGFFFVLSFSLVGCSFFEKDASVIEVGTVHFSNTYFADRLIEKLKNVDGLHIKNPELVSSFSLQLQKELITEGFFYLWAEKQKIQPTKTALASLMEKSLTNKAQQTTDFVFESPVNKRLLQDHLRLQLIKNQLYESLRHSITSTDEEAQVRYKKNGLVLSAPEVRIKQIVLSDEGDAKSVLQKLSAGSAFESMAIKFSLSPEGSAGGDLGWIKEGESPFFKSLAGSPIGLVKKVFTGPNAFYLFKVVEVKKSAPQSFDKVRGRLLDEIKSEKLNEAYLLWLQDQVKTVRVSVNEPLLRSITSRYQETL